MVDLPQNPPKSSNEIGAESKDAQKLNPSNIDQFANNSQQENPQSSSPSNLTTSKLWDEIGFHKPMAGFWYNITYSILGILVSAVTMGYFMSFFYPYPESWGYKDLAFGLFNFLFLIFDIGTSAVMGRFIPEANINDPKRMLHYIQYFIWYQMCTGLLQTTIVSIYALLNVTSANISYLVTLMLVVSITQYPGFLGVFSGALDALQQYHKSQTARFVGGTVMSTIISLAFTWYGRVYGASHPETGEIMGIAIGSAIGQYLTQFIGMTVAAIYFTRTMKDYGLKASDCFRIEFTWEEVKPMVIYAIKTSIPGIVSGALNLFNLYIWMTFLPQYTSFTVLAGIGGSITDVINWFGSPNITSLISESYNNKKIKLTQYYVGQLARFIILLQGFFVPMLVTVTLVMPIAWLELKMDYYVAGTVFMIPHLIRIVVSKYFEIPGQILYGANRPNWGMISGIIQSFCNTGLLFLYLAVWQIPTTYGLLGMAIIYELGMLPLDFMFSMAAYLYTHKKVIPIKFPYVQMLLGFALPSFITGIFTVGIKFWVFDLLYQQYGFFVSIIPSILAIACCLFFVYFPLTALLGGWDNINLEEFRKTASMSGPSKWIVVPIYKIINFVCKHSPLHGRFEMSTKGVVEEAAVLLSLKQKNRDIFKESLN